MELNQEIKSITDAIVNAVPVERIYLFGSHAKGNPRQDSDIDVAFVVNDWQGDYFDVILPIWKLTELVDYRIEPHVIVPEEDYAGFLNEIEHTGIKIA